jgi:hypothetical protein
VGGQHIAYTAIAGTITVGATDTDDAQLGPDGKPLPGSQLALAAPKEPADAPPVAHMFYVAYFKTGANAEDRPITFFYNGGPGSSTMWLHMGSLGPKYVETAGDTHLPGAPYKLIDNTDSLLDVSDEVFIDMPGTGFGRLAGKDAGKAFWGVDQDAEAFARFHRTLSGEVWPMELAEVFLWRELWDDALGGAGRHSGEREEYRPERRDAAGSRSSTFPWRQGGPRPGMDLPYELALPTYAATAWYHKKLSPEPPALDPFLKEVEDFALGDYMRALAQRKQSERRGKAVSGGEAARLHRVAGRLPD